MSQSTTKRTRRPRDPDASRAAILDAAREVFGAAGYDRATVREIARRARASNGLVLRHFGSKRELFLAALGGPPDRDHLPPASGGEFVDRVVAGVAAGVSGPFLALLRSAATNPDAAKALRAAVADRIVGLADDGNSDDPTANGLQVDLVGSVLIGATFVREILGGSPLAACNDAELAAALEPVLRAAWASGRAAG